MTMHLKKKKFYIMMLGPMFSGKTDLMRAIINKYALGKAKNFKCLQVKFSNDTRYTADDKILSHSGTSIENRSGEDQPVHIEVRIIHAKDLFSLDTDGFDMISIDELHFVCDPTHAIENVADKLEQFVKRVVYTEERILCTASNDFWDNGTPIIAVLNLIKLSHDIIRLVAKCDVCGKFNATLSKFKGYLEGVKIVPGGADHWMALCYECFAVKTEEYKRLFFIGSKAV